MKIGLKEELTCPFCDGDNEIMVNALQNAQLQYNILVKTEEWNSHMYNKDYKLDSLQKLCKSGLLY